MDILSSLDADYPNATEKDKATLGATTYIMFAWLVAIVLAGILLVVFADVFRGLFI